MTVGEIIKNNMLWRPGKNYDTGRPVLTVLMPTFARAQSGLFKQAVESFIEQSLKEIELIIIDDASTDGTEDIIKELMDRDERISTIRHINNIGLPAISCFEAFLKAKGEYIGFLFDDCKIYPSVYEDTLAIMKERKAVASYGKVFAHTSKDDLSQGAWVYFEERDLEQLEYTNYLGNLSMVCHRSVFEDIGWYDPHVVMLRINDWDMWLRIKRKFELINTGIEFGEEFGITQQCSLGNSATIDHSVILEHQVYLKNREDLLKLKNYKNYEVNKPYENASCNYVISLYNQLCRFEDKKWFLNEQTKAEIKQSTKFVRDFILVTDYSGRLTTSSSYAFNSTLLGEENIFVYPEHYNHYAQLRAIIANRFCSADNALIQKAKYTGIPVYLMWDDNFIELAKHHTELAFMTEAYARQLFEQFGGIIATSEKLMEYFVNGKYHEKVYLIEPIYAKGLEQKVCRREKSEVVNIAFIGGSWRDASFAKYVFPALKNLSRIYPIKLICPDYDNIKELIKKEKLSFEVEYIPFTYSFEQLVYKYGKHNIHIQLHPGSDNPNNIYKTKNALMIASWLGCPLVTSDKAPYNLCEVVTPYLLAEDKTISWYNAIESLILDEEMRLKIVNDAREYCAQRYDGKLTAKLAEEIIKETKPLDYLTYLNRLQKSAKFIPYAAPAAADFPIVQAINRPSRVIDVPLCLSKPIKNKTSYSVICNKDAFSEIGLIFSSLGSYGGRLRINILASGKHLRQIETDLSNVGKEAWSYASFEPIKGAKGIILTIELIFDYTPDSACIGVYENSLNRKFMYKVLNKLGHHIKGMDALFIDLR